MFKKVLLAMDSSTAARELLNSIPDLRRMGMEELHIVHVVNLEMLHGESVDHYRDLFRKKISLKMDAIRKLGISAELHLPCGHPADTIAEVAEEQDVDLILIGSIGESILRELLLGSTVAEVIRLSSKPVLVEKFITLGERTRLIPVSLQKCSTVILPTDFSSYSADVYTRFLNASFRIHRLILLHVLEKTNEKGTLSARKEKAQLELRKWAEKFQQKGIKAEIQVVSGVPSQEIIHVADIEGATLIAMPTRGLGLLKSIIGRTADAVVRNSGIPVLLFKIDR